MKGLSGLSLSVCAVFVVSAAAVASAQEVPASAQLETANRGKPWVRNGNGDQAGGGGGLPGDQLLNSGKSQPEDVDRGWTLLLMNLGKPQTDDRDDRLPAIVIPPGSNGGPVVKGGIGITASRFPTLASTACDQIGITGCEADDWGFGPAIFVEMQPVRDVPIGIGLRGGYTSVSVSQSYSGPGLPDTSTIDLDIWSVTLYGTGSLKLAERTSLSGTLGALWAWNRATVTSVFDAGRLEEHRSESGIRFAIGAGVEHMIASRTCLRLEYRFINGDSGDADRQHEIGLSIGYGLAP